MKIIVTHSSPDWDGIASIWLIKKYLPGWQNAQIQFVPAGDRLGKLSVRQAQDRDVRGEKLEVIEHIGENEVIHVDTGLGALDHHRTESTEVSAASLTWDFIKLESDEFRIQNEKIDARIEAIERIVKIVTDTDHFKEVFWDNPTADYHEFSLLGVLEGLKLQKPGEDTIFVEFGLSALDALLHNFENRIWAEKEIKEKGIEFETKWGKAVGFETINDSVLKLAQKMGYVVVVRRDPRKGYVRVKARPSKKVEKVERVAKVDKEEDVDLTNVYEKLKKMDPDATWFLHVSKKMLLNGTTKNPKMRPTKLSLSDIIEAIKGA